MVELPVEDKGKVDVFVDDKVGACPDIDDNGARLLAAMLLSMDLLAADYDDFPLQRKDMANIEKLLAEGRIEELKIVLGWLIDTRRLRISLPENKYRAWKKDVIAMIEAPTTTHSVLESLLGKLNHAMLGVPMGRHFLERLKFAKEKTAAHPLRPYTLNSTIKEDLKLSIPIFGRNSRCLREMSRWLH